MTTKPAPPEPWFAAEVEALGLTPAQYPPISAAALAVSGSADEPGAPAAPAYLSGYTAFQDNTEPEDVRQMLGGNFELYADNRKAIFRVLLRGEGGSMSWLERVFVRPEQIAMMRELCAMLKEAMP